MFHATFRSARLALAAACAAAAFAASAPAQDAPAQDAAATPDKPLHWSILPVPGSGGRMTSIRQSPLDPKQLVLLGDMLGVGVSDDGGASWKAGGFGLLSYEMGDATFDPAKPGVVWVGSMSGPARSADGGVTFEPRRGGMGDTSGGSFTSPVERVLFDPNDPGRLIAFGGSSRKWRQDAKPYSEFGRVWQSTDDGESWSLLCSFTPDGSVPRDATDEYMMNINAMTFLAGSSTDLLASAFRTGEFVGTGIYRSTDGGRTWMPSSKGLPHGSVMRIIAHPTDPKIAFAALGSNFPEGAKTAAPGGIYKTTDGGLSWTSISNGLTQLPGPDRFVASRYQGFGVCPQNPDRMVAWDAGWAAGISYLTTDGGAHWEPTATRRHVIGDEIKLRESQVKAMEGHPIQDYEPLTPYTSGFSMENVSWSATDPNLVFASGVSYACKSTDGGRTWQELLSAPEGESAYGPAWRGTGYNGLVATDITFDPSTPGKYIVQAMDTGRVWLTTDGGSSWTLHCSDPESWGGGRVSAFSADGKMAYAALGQEKFNGVARSADGGKHWDVLYGPDHGLPAKGSPGEPGGLAVDPRDGRRAFVELEDKLWRTDDGGDTWRSVYEAEGLGRVVSDPIDPSRLLLGSKAGVLRYPIDGDAGAVESLGGPTGSYIAGDPSGVIYATEFRGPNNGGLWRRDPQSGVWTRIFADAFANGVAIDPSNPRRLAVVTDDHPYRDRTGATGVYLSDDGGRTWAAADDGLPVLRGQPIAFDPHDPAHLVVGTGGRGWFQTRWPEGMALGGAVPMGDGATLTAPSEAAETPRAEAAEPGTLVNGAMNVQNGAIPGWEVSWTGSGGVKLSPDKTTFASAPSSLHAVTSDGTAAVVAQRLAGEAGRTIRVAGRLRTAGDVGVSFGVKSMKKWDKVDEVQIKYLKGTHDWTPFSGTVTLPPGTTQISVGFSVNGAGEVWLDDVTLQDAAAGK